MALPTFEDLRSLEQRVAEMSPKDIDAILDDLETQFLQWSWDWTARPDQLSATLDYMTHIVGLIGGRGSGKTRTGAEWVRKRVGLADGPRIFALVGRTAADVRDVIIQGESGLLHVFPPSEAPKYTASNRRIDFYDGSYGIAFSAEEPGQLRGPQFHYGWADELAAWDLRPDDSGANAWDNLQFATRLKSPSGKPPQILFTTTPKRIQMLRELFERAKHDPRLAIYNQASTYHNVHLAEQFMDAINSIHGGTRLAAQEIGGKMLDTVEGALWTDKTIEDNRIWIDPGRLPIRVVGVDPTTAENPGDECGIVVCGATPKEGPAYRRTGYVLDDRTVFGAPSVWAPAVVAAAKDWDAEVVAEQNQGGVLVRDAIQSLDSSIRVRLVTAKQSKKLRAEPVAMASEQNRVKFFRRFPELEDQMCSWVPHETKDSPDRIDAMVHAFTGVITITGKVKTSGGRASVSNPAKGRSLGVVRRAS